MEKNIDDDMEINKIDALNSDNIKDEFNTLNLESKNNHSSHIEINPQSTSDPDASAPLAPNDPNANTPTTPLKPIISNEKAMKILSIKTKSAMSKLAKKEGLNSIKKWREVFYYKDEILKLKKYRETNPHKKSASKKALELAIIHNRLQNQSPTRLEVKNEIVKFQNEEIQGNLQDQLEKVSEIFKSLGLYLEIDAPLIKAYIRDGYFLDEIRSGLKKGIVTADEKGREWLSAEFDGYLRLCELQLKREKALGIGAGNRKGTQINPPIEVSEMDGLIDE